MLSLCVIVKFPTFPIHKISITLLLILICLGKSCLYPNTKVQKYLVYMRLSSHWKSSFLLLVIIPFHHIIDLPSGFDLLPVVKFTLLAGCEIQEIPCSPVWLPVIPEQVKGVLDIRYLFRVKTWLVIITGETDDTVYRLTEDIARFEQKVAYWKGLIFCFLPALSNASPPCLADFRHKNRPNPSDWKNSVVKASLLR